MRDVDDLPCRDVVELVTAYLDDALPADERHRFEQHLRDCGGCEEYLAQIRTTVALTGHLNGAAIPPPVVAALEDAFAEWQQGRLR